LVATLVDAIANVVTVNALSVAACKFVGGACSIGGTVGFVAPVAAVVVVIASVTNYLTTTIFAARECWEQHGVTIFYFVP